MLKCRRSSSTASLQHSRSIRILFQEPSGSILPTDIIVKTFIQSIRLDVNARLQPFYESCSGRRKTEGDICGCVTPAMRQKRMRVAASSSGLNLMTTAVRPGPSQLKRSAQRQTPWFLDNERVNGRIRIAQFHQKLTLKLTVRLRT